MAGDFADLVVWKEAAELAASVCTLTRRLRGPGAAVLADQMVRASVSIAANIAEGYGRGLRKDGLRLLVVARASAAELESHLRVAVGGRLLAARDAEPLIQRSRSVRYLIRRFAESVERRMPA